MDDGCQVPVKSLGWGTLREAVASVRAIAILPLLEPVRFMRVPTIEFTDERLANGLRLIIAEDHLAPVAAVNLWYAVGSKHEVAGKTGFAHLFEHVMFH